MKNTSSDFAHERCQYRTRTGRQCTSRVLDPESSHCSRHAAAEPRDFEDFEANLTRSADHFLNAQGINYSLATLYRLLASGRISPRRASVLAYISNLLLRSLTAIDNDPHPNAGKPKNSVPQNGAGGDPSNNLVPPNALPPGTTPMPATRKEFAQQVFAQLKQNEGELPAHVLNNPIYKAHTANLPPSPPSLAPPAPPESPPA